MEPFQNQTVANVFAAYPKVMQQKLLQLRQLVFDTAAETDEVKGVEESLKWGEPSYLSKTGSTLRMDWKSAAPDHYAMYFHCQTKLVDTFRELYRDLFQFEGNRAIVFHVDDVLPVEELKHCILLSLTYHQRKHLPMLGV